MTTNRRSHAGPWHDCRHQRRGCRFVIAKSKAIQLSRIAAALESLHDRNAVLYGEIRKGSYGLKPKDARRLKAARIKHATVCGVDTDACVTGVMFSLFDADIVLHLKENLCWSSTGLHNHALKILR